MFNYRLIYIKIAINDSYNSAFKDNDIDFILQKKKWLSGRVKWSFYRELKAVEQPIILFVPIRANSWAKKKPALRPAFLNVMWWVR
jgi:hypothetical protein